MTLITGENGAGKSILLDAIRGMFGLQYCELERPIWRKNVPFSVAMDVLFDGKQQRLTSREIGDGNSFARHSSNSSFHLAPIHAQTQARPPEFITDFWRTTQATDSHDIQGFTFDVAKRIFELSLPNGHFDEVDRLNFTPMVFQSGQRVPLANMSGGNAYLI